MKLKIKTFVIVGISCIAIVFGWQYFEKVEPVSTDEKEDIILDSAEHSVLTNSQYMDTAKSKSTFTIKSDNETKQETNDGLGRDVILSQERFTIYAFYDRFKPATRKYFQRNNIREYQLIANAFIDPDKDGKINEDRVKKFLMSRFPETNTSGVCVIDWEKKHYWNLRKYKPGDKEFDTAETEFIKLVELIKTERPNLKVGIYGIPFKESYKVVRGYNKGNKFDKVLSYTDFMAPDLYIRYSDEEIGHENNMLYFERNLEIALNYAKRLNKPHIPFFWFRILPKNPKYGGEVISQDLMLKYLNKIASYKHGGVGVSGIFWWSPHTRISTPKNSKLGKATRSSVQNDMSQASREEISQAYMEAFLKQKN